MEKTSGNVIKELNTLDNNTNELSTIKESKTENESLQKTKSNKKTFDPDDYVLMMQIGQGNFSELFLVEHKITKILYCQKMFTKMRVEQLKKQEDVLMEKHVMEKISEHKNIIKYYGSYKDEMCLYILYEYVNGGELWRKSTVYGLPSEKLIKFYFLQALDGISHLHSYNIVHRDIKPENIMVTKDELTAKIIDFGSCKDMEGTEFEIKFDLEREKQKNKKPTYKNFVGTAQYMAPECVRNRSSDFKSDLWSLGCLLYQLFTGFPPFLGKSDYLIFIKSTEAKYSYPDDIVSPEAVDLISKLLVIDPAKRLTIQEVYSHPFLTNENLDSKFREKLPTLTQDEKYLLCSKNKLKQKFSQYKLVSGKLNRIKKYEEMEEQCKKNEIGEEPDTPETIENKKLLAEKPSLLEKYEHGLQNCIKEIEEFKRSISSDDMEKQKKWVNTWIFFEKQILHDLFNIDYEG